jgi:hypothetical protein
MPDNRLSENEVLRVAFGPGKDCPSLDALVELAEDTTTPASLAQHLNSCSNCRTELHLLRTFQAGETQQNRADVRRITEQLRKRQFEVTSVAEPVTRAFTAPRASWWRSLFTVRRLAPAGFAMAALLLVAAAAMYFRHSSQPVLEATNRGGQEVFRSSSFALVTPVGDLQEQPREIRWEPVQAAAKYQVQLLEVDRSEVWKAETSGDHIDLPAAIRERMVPAKTLFWEIRALSASGSIIGDTGLVRFRLLPHAQQPLRKFK